MLNPEDDIEKIYRDFAKNYPLKTDDSGWDEFLQKMEGAPLNGAPANKPGVGSPLASIVKKYAYWLTPAALLVIITGVLFLQNKNDSRPPAAQPTGITTKAPAAKQLANTSIPSASLQSLSKQKQTEPADAVGQPAIAKTQQLQAKGTAENATTIKGSNKPFIQQEDNAKPINKRNQNAFAKTNQPVMPGLMHQNNQMQNSIKQGVGKDLGLAAQLNNGVPANSSAIVNNNNNTNSSNTAVGENSIAENKGQNIPPQPTITDSIKNIENTNPVLAGNSSKEATNFKKPTLSSADSAESITGTSNILNKSSTQAIATPAQKQAGNAGKTQPMVKVNTQANNYFYLGLVAGPDFSTVKFQKVKHTGFTTGVSFGIHVSNNASIESGILYSEKNYYSSGEYFKAPNLPPPSLAALQSISGKGKFLEIPLTVKYNFINKKHYGFFVNGGFSSYFTKYERFDLLYRRLFGNEVLREDDDRLFANIFSVIHLSAGYQLKINASNNIRFEPYIKIPLSGLGSGYLPITSSGLYINFTHSFLK